MKKVDFNRIIKRLKGIGLTLHESKCYLSLLERDVLTVTEISKLAEIPTANAYRTMEKLLDKGLCVSKLGKIKGYTVSDPSFLMEKMVAVQDEKYEEFKKEITAKMENRLRREKVAQKTAEESIASLVKEITPIYKSGRNNEEPFESIDIVKNLSLAQNRIFQLYRSTEKEILATTKPSLLAPWPPAGIEIRRKILTQDVEKTADAVKRGVEIRNIYELSPDDERRKWQLYIIGQLTQAGEKIRIIKRLPIKTAIFDSKIAAIVLENSISGKFYTAAQFINHQGMTEILKRGFETLWAEAEDYEVFLEQEKTKSKT